MTGIKHCGIVAASVLVGTFVGEYISEAIFGFGSDYWGAVSFSYAFTSGAVLQRNVGF